MTTKRVGRRSASTRAFVNVFCGALAMVPARVAADPADLDVMSIQQLNELSLEDLLTMPVATATKAEQNLAEVPAIMTVITGEELRRWGYHSLQEALKHVLGFYVVDDHVMPNALVRGLGPGLFGESSSVKLLINGTTAQFRPTQGNSLGMDLLPILAVDRIEIIRGPASALYGANAFLGVINVITRKAFQPGHAEASGALIHNGHARQPGYEISGIVGDDRTPVRYSLSVSHVTEDRSGLMLPPSSPRPIVSSNRVGTAGISNRLGQTSTSVYGLAEWQANAKLKVGAKAYYSRMARDMEFGNLLHLANFIESDGHPSVNRIARQQAFANLYADWHVTDRLDLTVNANYFMGTPLAEERLEAGSDLVYFKRRYGAQGFDLNAEARGRLNNLSLTGGLEFTDDIESLPINLMLAKTRIGSISPGQPVETPPGQPVLHLWNFGAYAQAQWTVVPKYLTLTGGARYDHHRIYRGQPSGRFGAVSSPTDQLTLKLLYGTAFKAPSPFLLFATPVAPGDILGNPDLLPERVHTVEFEASYRFTPSLIVQSTLSYGIMWGAQFVNSGAYREAVNLGRLDSLSWESSLRWFVVSNVDLYLRTELNHTRRIAGSTGYERELVGTAGSVYPAFQGHVGVAKTFARWHLRGSVEYSFVTQRRASVDNILENGGAYYLPAYHRLDAGVSLVDVYLFPSLRTEASVVMRNIVGDMTADPGFAGVDYPRLSRSLFITLRQQL